MSVGTGSTPGRLVRVQLYTPCSLQRQVHCDSGQSLCGRYVRSAASAAEGHSRQRMQGREEVHRGVRCVAACRAAAVHAQEDRQPCSHSIQISKSKLHKA